MSVEEQAEQVRKVKKFESGVVKDPITIQQNATIAELMELTSAHGISGVPVLDGAETWWVLSPAGTFALNPTRRNWSRRS
jgi:IMP dehydrogenase